MELVKSMESIVEWLNKIIDGSWKRGKQTSFQLNGNEIEGKCGPLRPANWARWRNKLIEQSEIDLLMKGANGPLAAGAACSINSAFLPSTNQHKSKKFDFVEVEWKRNCWWLMNGAHTSIPSIDLICLHSHYAKTINEFHSNIYLWFLGI